MNYDMIKENVIKKRWPENNGRYGDDYRSLSKQIDNFIEHVKKEASPEYLFGQEDLLAAVVEEEETDPLFTQACSFIIEQGSASTSLLQRHFSIGYNRAAKLMDRIEAHGFISEQRGSRSRDVYATEADLDAFLNPTEDA